MDREEEDEENEDGSGKFSTQVNVNVDKLTITSSGSPYSPLYNLLIEEYTPQIVNLLKFFSETQLSEIVSNFCNQGNGDQCTLANAEEWFEVLDHYVEYDDDADYEDVDDEDYSGEMEGEEGYDDAVEA